MCRFGSSSASNSVRVYATVNVPFGFSNSAARRGTTGTDSQLPIISIRGANFTKCFTSQFSMATRAFIRCSPALQQTRGVFSGGIFATILIGAIGSSSVTQPTSPCRLVVMQLRWYVLAARVFPGEFDVHFTADRRLEIIIILILVVSAHQQTVIESTTNSEK